MKASLKVFFENPFWVGVFERIEDGKLSVCKVTFGAEPKDYEVLEYVLQHYFELVFSQAIETEIRQAADNPKRRSRNARKQLENMGIGTKSQQECEKAAGEHGYRDEISAGSSKTAGRNEKGAQTDQPGRTGDGGAAPI